MHTKWYAYMIVIIAMVVDDRLWVELDWGLQDRKQHGVSYIYAYILNVICRHDCNNHNCCR